MIHPVILSGGSGTRLWPVSRALFPKQLLPLDSDHSMLQETALRVAETDFAAPTIICNEDHRFIVAEQMRAIDVDPLSILLEPVRRNTAPAVAAAALALTDQDPDALMLVMPSDHVIRDPKAFRTAVTTAAQAARDGALVTFGIHPDSPETGYGYIRKGDPWPEADGCFRVERFVEKPDRQTAEKYLKEGTYQWNGGMFLFAAARYLAELQRLHPEMLDACRAAVTEGTADLDFFRLDRASFEKSPALSIDYAVMEQTSDAAVVPVDMGWSDVGSWTALWQIGEKDTDGNVTLGDVVTEDVRNCYIRGDGALIAAIGLEDTIIVATDDAILVAASDRAQDVKTVVEALRRENRMEPEAHSTVYRPWGNYRCVDLGDRFQVKRITVKPGGKLSLQAHNHRAEHWVVVSGVAKVTCDDDVFMLTENQSTYIPAGARHRLENPGDQPTHLIEVQSGSYLGEDDIIRFEDVYGRG